MGGFAETRLDIVEFNELNTPDLPLAIDDTTLSYHIGINNWVLWWIITNKNQFYYCFAIPKRSGGGKRFIQEPTPKLKKVQKAFLAWFLSGIAMDKHIGAYVLGRSCMDTAAQHIQKAVIISMDIKDFFPSVKRAMIRRVFKEMGYNHYVAGLIADLVTYKNFVPQGAPTSGFIANIVADRLIDQPIIKELHKLDPLWVYTRYSDDIDLSHPELQSERRIEEVIRLVQRCMRNAGFRVNEKKTHVDPYWKRQKVLGMVVNDKINIQRSEYRLIKAIIRNCITYGLDSQAEKAGKQPGELKSYLKGKITYYRQINPAKADKLAEMMDAVEVMDISDTQKRMVPASEEEPICASSSA